MIIPSFILPQSIKLAHASLVSQSPGLLIRAVSTKRRSFCPKCCKSSKSIHSRYERKFSDMPVSGKAVNVIIESRKFFCKNRKCKRKIFTERFDSQIGPYGRSFHRYVDIVKKLGVELGGNKGSAISQVMGYPVSASTVLRKVKQISLKGNVCTSGVIGVDDWAFKKGRNYGTIIVDLEKRKVIDLLPDREADTLARWLTNHPEVHTVSRDRASAYALGIRTGAPHAVQVADRFHLLVNLTDALRNALRKHSKVIKESFQAYSHPNDLTNKQKEEIPEEVTESKSQSEGLFIGNVGTDKQYKFQKAKELHQMGYSIKAIARQLGAGRKTIRKYITTECLKSKETLFSKSFTNFSGFEPELLRLYSPKTTYLSLFNHIVKLGFNGKYTQFCERMNRFMYEGKNSRTRVKGHLPKLKPVKIWSVSKLAFMALSEEDLKEEEQNFLNILFGKSSEIKDTVLLANSFKELFKTKKEGSLKEWIKKAKSCDSGLKNFAKGIESDFEAVNQAVISNISNGQVEGQVNRLKTIKRQMYGRAGYNLLKKMVLSNSG